MKIVVYQDYLRVGGTESQSLYLARRFQESGDDVVVLTNRPGGSLSHRATDYGLKHRSLQKKDWRLNWFAPGLIPFLKNMSPDVVLLMGRNANGWGARLMSVLPTSAILSTFRTGRTLTRSYRNSLMHAQVIYCNSQYAANRLQNLGIGNGSIEVHPNPCMRAIDIETQDAHARKKSKALRLIYVAAFVPGKNHQGLIRVFLRLIRQFPDLKLSLVGEGPLMQTCSRQVQALGLSERVDFEGYRKDVPQLLSQADIAVSTSVEESMPNALVEAQYAGLPVVAYDVAGVKECFVPGESGLSVRVHDEREFCKAILGLLVDEERRKVMGETAKIFARKQFNPDLRFDAFYKSVLKCCKKR